MLLSLQGYSVGEKPRKDGLFEGKYPHDGTRKSIYGKSREEVLYKLQRIARGEKPKTKQRKVKSYTVRSWLAYFRKTYKSNLRESTIKMQGHYERRINEVLGDIKMSALSTQQCKAYFDSIKGTRARDLIYCFLNEALCLAMVTIENGKPIIPYNPVAPLKYEKHVTEESKPMENWQAEIFEKEIFGHKHEIRFLTILYACTRPAETLALTREDYTGSTLNIDKSIADDGKLKNKRSYRQVPLSPKLKEASKRCPFHNIKVRGLEDAFKAVLDKIIKKHPEQAEDWQDLTQYSMRHTCATAWKEQGVPDEVIAKWMGNHKDVANKVYIHVRKDFEKEFIEKVTGFYDNFTTESRNTLP